MKMYFGYTHYNRTIRAILMSTLNIKLFHYFGKTSLKYPRLFPDLALKLTLSGSNYPCQEYISKVQNIFESFKFDCINPL